REAGVIWIGPLLSSVAGQAAGICGQINFNQIRNENSRNVSPPCLDVRQLAIEDNLVDQSRQFWSLRVLAEQRIIRLGARAAVAILVGGSNQTLVKERITLTRDLYPGAMKLLAVIPHEAVGFVP